MTGEVRSADCLDPETMAAYADGRLDTGARANVERHLADCDECYERFSEMVHALITPTSLDVMTPGRKAAELHSARWRGLISAVAALLVLGIGLAWWWSPGQRLNRAISALADAQRTNRFAEGRLSIDTRWSPRPTELRGSTGSEAPLDVLDASVRIKRLTVTASNATTLRARALAEAATGQLDASIDDLRQAVSSQQGGKAEVRSDLAAVLLERNRTAHQLTDVVDALDLVGLALSETPGFQPALFNKALALDILGPRTLAIDAWQAYLVSDSSSRWADEARQRLAALRARPEDPRAKTTALFHTLDRTLLPAWAAHAIVGDRVDTTDLASALARLSAATTDRETLDIGHAAVAAPQLKTVRRTCLARAIVQLDQWDKAYERVDQAAAQNAATDAEASLRCAGLPPVVAQIRLALAGDRNAVFQRLGELADTATKLGYFRIASLARIARGNSALRRAELTDSMSEFQTARNIAYAAGDLELSATADAMMADGSRELGDVENTWHYLRSALEGLPAAANLRLVYSITQAAAGAALNAGHSAASLPYSKLLLDATADWKQPGGRILAARDRARAFQNAGDVPGALAAIAAAEPILQTEQDPQSRAELSAEMQLARGRVWATHDPGSALPLLSSALVFFERQHTSERMAAVLLELGRAYEAEGNTTAARRELGRAVALVENQQPSVRDEQLRISRFSSLWDVFAELQRVDRPDPSESLAASERAHARELLDSLAPTQGALPLSGTALWNWLPLNATAVVYSELSDDLLIWTVDRSGPRLQDKQISVTTLEGMVHRASNAIREGRDDGVDDLSRLLLDVLPAGSPDKTLLIVPDGALHFLPFAALRIPGTSLRLVENWTPVIAPSLSVARMLAEKPHRSESAPRILLADYDGGNEPGLSRLRGVHAEIQDLRSLYASADVIEGTDATPEAVLQRGSDSSVIHIAAHGIVNMAYPSRSFILLAPASHGGGLTPAQIASARLTGSPVVVLSACESAVGSVYRGEGQMSLARAFLIAGASSVIAAQYRVNDENAPAFLLAIHAYLRTGVAGPQALASAQRNAAHDGTSTKDWAVFMAAGSPSSDK